MNALTCSDVKPAFRRRARRWNLRRGIGGIDIPGYMNAFALTDVFADETVDVAVRHLRHGYTTNVVFRYDLQRGKANV